MGNNREREMAQTFDASDWAVLRAPSSGGGTTREAPDIIAGNGTRRVAIEEKYRTSKTRCYLSEEEVRGIEFIAEQFDAELAFAVRYSTNLDGVGTADWFMAEPSDVPQTESGKYKLHHDIVKDFPTFTEMLAIWDREQADAAVA